MMEGIQIIADESVDFRIVKGLRQSSVHVYSVAEQLPGLTDAEVLKIAFNSKALLITEDKDFGELVFRMQLPHYGILLIRVDDPPTKISKAVSICK